MRGPDTVPADEALEGERSGLGKHKCGMLEMMAVFAQETCSGTETHDLLTAHTQTFTQKKLTKFGEEQRTQVHLS